MRGRYTAQTAGTSWLLGAVLLFGTAASFVRTPAARADGVTHWELKKQAANYRRMGMFREAAEDLERYASPSLTEYIGSDEMADALADAARLWMALGEGERAARCVERFERLLRLERERGGGIWIDYDRPRTDPRETLAAELRLELGVHYAEHKPLAFQAAYWERALRSPFVSRSLAHRIRAEVKLAQVRWLQSCPIAQEDGLCVRWRPYRAPTTGGPRCEPWTKLDEPQVWPRDARLVAAALQGVRRALAPYPVALILAQRQGDEPMAHLGDAVVIEAVEGALLLQADERYERFLALAVPPDLGQQGIKFDPRYTRWLRARSRPMDEARSRHLDLLALSDGVAGQTAAARLAQSLVLAVAGLWWIPLPSPPPAPKGVDQAEWAMTFPSAYCDSLDSRDIPRPIEDRLTECVDRARRLGIRTHGLHQCERIAAALGLSQWRAPAEIHLSPVHMALPLDRADVQTVTTTKR